MSRISWSKEAEMHQLNWHTTNEIFQGQNGKQIEDIFNCLTWLD